MCAIARKGHAVEERASCAKCLYVNLDFVRRALLPNSGEEGWNGCDDDMIGGFRIYCSFKAC